MLPNGERTPSCASCTAPFRRCARRTRPSIARCRRSGTPTRSRSPLWRCLMRVADLGSRRVAVWGLAREGRAAIKFLRKHHPNLPLLLLDDAADASAPDKAGGNITCAFGADRIAGALAGIDVIVKSPGVSLYRPEIRWARDNGTEVTSLLNLWFGEQLAITTICVTGTKGKSTTASLIAHLLAGLGRKVALVGNIG